MRPVFSVVGTTNNCEARMKRSGIVLRSALYQKIQRRLTVRIAGLEVGGADGAVLALLATVQGVRLDQVRQLHQLLGLPIKSWHVSG